MKSLKALIAAAILFAPISAFSYEVDQNALAPESKACGDFAHTLKKVEDTFKDTSTVKKGVQSTNAS